MIKINLKKNLINPLTFKGFSDDSDESFSFDYVDGMFPFPLLFFNRVRILFVVIMLDVRVAPFYQVLWYTISSKRKALLTCSN